MINTMWDYLYDNYKWLYHILRKPLIFYRNYWIDETHIYRTGVKRGTYADHRYRLSYVIRNTFLSYVNEVVDNHRSWKNKEETNSVKEILDWEEKHNNIKDFYNIYLYVKYRRDEIVELENRLLDLSISDLEMYSDKDNKINFNRGPNNEKYSDLHWKVEEHLYHMDQKYLHKIVDIIPYMWT